VRGATDAGGNVLVRIKRAVLAGRYAFSEKARIEMEIDGLTELDIAESILNAVAIYKTVRFGTSRVRARESSYHPEHQFIGIAYLFEGQTR
jgi:hypothetical protein